MIATTDRGGSHHQTPATSAWWVLAQKIVVADGREGHVGETQDAQGHLHPDRPEHVVDGGREDDRESTKAGAR